MVDIVVGEIAGLVVDGGKVYGQARTTGQDDSNRHRLLALPQVVACGLARNCRIAPDSEDVVHSLKGQAQFSPEGIECIDGRLRCTGQHGTYGRGTTHQGTGLVGLHCQAVLKRHDR